MRGQKNDKNKRESDALRFPVTGRKQLPGFFADFLLRYEEGEEARRAQESRKISAFN